MNETTAVVLFSFMGFWSSAAAQSLTVAPGSSGKFFYTINNTSQAQVPVQGLQLQPVAPSQFSIQPTSTLGPVNIPAGGKETFEIDFQIASGATASQFPVALNVVYPANEFLVPDPNSPAPTVNITVENPLVIGLLQDDSKVVSNGGAATSANMSVVATSLNGATVDGIILLDSHGNSTAGSPYFPPDGVTSATATFSGLAAGAYTAYAYDSNDNESSNITFTIPGLTPPDVSLSVNGQVLYSDLSGFGDPADIPSTIFMSWPSELSEPGTGGSVGYFSYNMNFTAQTTAFDVDEVGIMALPGFAWVA